MNRSSPAECPVCGASVPPGARACPECGADERSGWNEDATRYDGLDLPGEAFEEESPPRSRGRRPLGGSHAWYWWVAAALLIVVLAVMSVGGR